jgi:hypothetical protein
MHFWTVVCVLWTMSVVHVACEYVDAVDIEYD